MPTTKPTDTEADALTKALPDEAYQNEQFKSEPDPVSPAVEPEKATPIDLAPSQPYPTGGAPTPDPEPKKGSKEP